MNTADRAVLRCPLKDMGVIAHVDDEAPPHLSVKIEHEDDEPKIMAAIALIQDIDPPCLAFTATVAETLTQAGPDGTQTPIDDRPKVMSAIAVIKDSDPQLLGVAVTVNEAA